MDRLVDEAETLGGAVHSSAITPNSRPQPIPDQQLSILNSITANDLTGKSKEAEMMAWKNTHTHTIYNTCMLDPHFTGRGLVPTLGKSKDEVSFQLSNWIEFNP